MELDRLQKSLLQAKIIILEMQRDRVKSQNKPDGHKFSSGAVAMALVVGIAGGIIIGILSKKRRNYAN